MLNQSASGLVAGINAANFVQEKELVVFPTETAIGSLAHYITSASKKSFQPMNVNFGLFPELETKIRAKQERNEKLAERALKAIKKVAEEL